MPGRRKLGSQKRAASRRRWLPRIHGRRTCGWAARWLTPLLLSWRPMHGTRARRSWEDSDRRSFFTDFQDREKGFLRNFNAADGFHPFLSFFLFFEQFALARNVTAITLCRDVFFHRSDRLTCNDLVADRRLNRDFEHLPGDQLLHLLSQLTPPWIRALFVCNKRERVNRLSV